MKNINIFFVPVFWLLLFQFLQSQELIKVFNPSELLYANISKNYSDIDLTKVKNNILFYEVNHDLIKNITTGNIDDVNLSIPFFNSIIFNIDIELVNNFNNSIQVSRYTQDGKIIEDYKSKIKIYQIKENKNNLDGVFIFSNTGFKAVFNYNDNTYQIDLLKQTNIHSPELYFICDINKSLVPFNFVCKNDLLNQDLGDIDNLEHRFSTIFGCIDVVIEIDYFTFQTFNSYQEALDWALEIIAVADVIYSNEIGVSIQTNSAQIWEIEDPYSVFINDPQNMLMSFRDYWLNDESLSSIDRHLVHLFSKRNNTGTGGIAFLNGVGSSWNGYGFSSNLTDEDNYIDLPVPYFFWNIYCLVHELGHNFGAKHTQWCGWPEGPIDNCTNIEEMSQGECSNFINNPAPQTGTIMSYCHTWSYESGGGIIMKFHDYVKEVVVGYMGLQNLYDCDNNEPILGCMDPIACNYNVTAIEDDQSCVYPDFNFDCFGNCLNDSNNNNICDEDEVFLASDEVHYNSGIIFPNPAYDFISIKTDNLSADLKIFNSKGQLVIDKQIINADQVLDISNISSGIYSAYLIGDSKIEQQSIIIQ